MGRQGGFNMRAGRLRHRITIQQPTTSTNAQGGKIKTWVDVATVWAGIEPISASESDQNHQLEPEVSVRIVMRYRSGITSDMRIKFGSRYYKIIGIINPDERNKELQITAIETKDFE